jgi:hypothetical protein
MLNNLLKSTTTAFLLFLLFLPLSTLPDADVIAQEQEGEQGQEQEERQPSGVSISPALAEITPGESYEIRIKNEESESVSVKLEKNYFRTNESGQIIPLVEQEVTEAANPDEFIELETNQLTIEPGSTQTVQVNYLKENQNYVLGVIARVTDISDSDDLGATPTLASVIIDKNLTEQELKDMKIDVAIEPVFGFSNINLVNNYLIKVDIENTGNTFIDLGGETLIYVNEKRIDSKLLSNELEKKMAPGEKVSTEIEYTDRRNSFERVGELNFQTDLQLNDKSVTKYNQLTSLPLEVIILSIILIGILLLIGTYLFKRFVLKSKS